MAAVEFIPGPRNADSGVNDIRSLGNEAISLIGDQDTCEKASLPMKQINRTMKTRWAR